MRPAPASTTARTLGSSSHWSAAYMKSLASSTLMALAACGRFSVRCATPSRIARSMVSYAMGPPLMVLGACLLACSVALALIVPRPAESMAATHNHEATGHPTSGVGRHAPTPGEIPERERRRLIPESVPY